MEEEQGRKNYKSPRRKLVKFFEKSRDQWKSKHQEVKKKAKQLKNRVNYLENSKKELKIHIKKLESELAQMKQEKDILRQENQLEDRSFFKIKPACHHYSVDHITLFIHLVLTAAASLRCASRVIETVVLFFKLSVELPTWCTGRLWLLRLGLYKLTRPKVKANDWVWIIDHTVQIGQEKTLVILGIRLSALPCPTRCLSHEDVEPIALLPVKKSNGDIVYEQLQEATKKTGVPREIISDKGTDLNAGISKYCIEHSETCAIYDIKHQSAVLLKKELEDDYYWKDFIRLCGETKKGIQQTELAYLLPPNQKSKSRYMNVDTLVKWGRKMLKYYDSVNVEDCDENKRLYEELGWITEFRNELEEWEEILKIAILIESSIRQEGIYRGCYKKLQSEMETESLGDRAKKFSTVFLELIQKEECKANPEERLLGSSEVIESVFGKLKRVEGDQSKNGFTGLLLSVAATASITTTEVVQKAMEIVPTKKVYDWYRDNLGKSVQAKRKEAFKTNKKTEQKQDQVCITL